MEINVNLATERMGSKMDGLIILLHWKSLLNSKISTVNPCTKTKPPKDKQHFSPVSFLWSIIEFFLFFAGAGSHYYNKKGWWIKTKRTKKNFWGSSKSIGVCRWPCDKSSYQWRNYYRLKWRPWHIYNKLRKQWMSNIGGRWVELHFTIHI